jgi:hypothetical protein
MSPELERLLAALYERDTCEPRERPRWHATVERLMAEAMDKQPGIGRDQVMEALRPRYQEFRRAHRKPSTLPPKA